jgi:hypothetical protein
MLFGFADLVLSACSNSKAVVRLFSVRLFSQRCAICTLCHVD